MASTLARYLSKRVVYLALTIFLIITFNFLLFRVMPGDIARIMIPKGAAPETIDRLTEHYGLDEPLITQYLIYLKQTFTWDLGESISFSKGAGVSDILGPYVFNTFLLVGIGTIIAIGVGIIFGRETAWRRGKAADRIGGAFFLIFYSMPTFLFALVLLTIVAQYSPDWPIKGATSADYDQMDILGKLLDKIKHLMLPVGALVVESIAAFSIITRSSLIDVLTEDYMLTAVAKGLRGRQVLKNHAMPNAMLPVVTVVALNVGWILSGAIMIEMIFTYPGLGYLTYKAVMGYDYPLIQAAFMLEAVAVVIANFLADMTLFKLDPRVKI